MAKKKRKHRTPIAPPIHSAPGTAQPPPRPSSGTPPTAPDTGAPAAVEAGGARAATRPRRETPGSRAAAKRRRSRRRNYLIGAAVLVALIAAIVVPRILSQRADAEFETLAKAAGCGEIESTAGDGEGQHLAAGEETTYDPLPPSFGEHAGSTLSAGVYEEPLSDDASADITIYKAVHSLEHGAVIIWHDGLKKDDVDELDREYSGEDKVIVTPYPPLRGDDHLAMTAWGRVVRCEEMSTEVIDAFIERFREARTAPEFNQPI